MSRARVPIAVLLVACLTAIAVLLATSAGAAPSKRFHYTHRVSVTGQLVDRWTINDPDRCGLVGAGSVTVNFRTAKAALARPYIDPWHASEIRNSIGSWVLGSPVGGGVGDLPPQPATGTVTRVDNTIQTPPPYGDCGDFDKSGCTTVPLGRPQSEVQGYDRRRLLADLSSNSFGTTRGVEAACHIGDLDLFSIPPSLAGGTRKGELLLTMPRPAKLAHRRVVHVTGTSHKLSKWTQGGVTYSEDVTRRVTVTFTHL